MLKFMRISKRMILGVVCSIAGSTLSFFVPLLIKDFIDNKKFDLSLLYVFPFLFAAQFILCAIGGLLISTEADLHVAELRIQAMDIIFEKDMLFFDNENSGEIASGIVYDISLVRNFVAASIPQFVSSVINILFSVVALTVINYRLSILVLIIFPAVMILTVPLGIFNNRNAMMLQERIGKLNTFTSEIVRSMRTIKLCNAERCMLLKFKKRVNEIKEVNLLNDKVYSFVTPVQNLISIFLYWGHCLLWCSSDGRTSLDIRFVCCICNVILSAGYSSRWFIYLLFELSNNQRFLKKNQPCHRISREVDMENFAYNNVDYLELKSVSFGYNDNEVLHDVSMRLEKGGRYAIIGPSGSGKTTIINTITGLYSANSGAIAIDESLLDGQHLEEWRRWFTVVSQDNLLFSTTIKENLFFGLDFVPSEKDINKCLKNACLDEIISVGDLEKSVGEQGMSLSGGQRQRLQIARACLRKAPILILDEATSNLDVKTERRVLDNLLRSHEYDISIVISHRLSTIIDSDVIFFIEDGYLLDQGDHRELIERCPAYRFFVQNQLLKD